MVKVVSFNFEQFSICLPFYLFNDPPKRDFLDIYLTTFFGVRKFKNTSANRVIFFFNMFKYDSKYRNCQKKNQQKFFVCEIIASENFAINCFCWEENTCHRQ